jgi:hypothetical protein
MRVTETVSEFGKDSETRQWIDSLRVAAEQAALVTETTKKKMTEFAPALDRAHENFKRTLVTVDSKLEEVAEEIDAGAQKVRDVIVKPALSLMAFASNLTKSEEEM